MAQSPIFSRVKAEYARTSLFNLGHEVKLTTAIGRLTPILCKEVLPGDTWRCNTEILVRLAPMLFPLMHQIKVYTHFFFVPYRLLWDNWETFITQSSQGAFTADAPKQIPLLNIQEYLGNGSLADYLGCQDYDTEETNIGERREDFYVNALPFYAYQKIYDDYYRDENLQDSDFEMCQDSPNPVSVGDYPLNLRYRSWKKDYFTSALPFVQKGPDITLPIGGEAPLNGSVHLFSNNVEIPPNTIRQFRFIDGDTGPTSQVYFNSSESSFESGDENKEIYGSIPGQKGSIDANLSLVGGSADLSQATAVTINELRRANALQRWEELNARGGTRYIEQLATHFNVRPQDARLQRAQFLGGGVSDVVISEVIQNSASVTGETPQGNMAGHGISASFNHAFKNYFSEHGVVIGIMSIMPRAEYYQGVDRMFLKRGVYDFAWPSLAHLGEQPIYESELYASAPPEDPETEDKIFGYTPRYAEYKFANDRICGDFRGGSLSAWHMGRKFANAPNLNGQFIDTSNFKTNVFADLTGDPFWCQLYLDCKVTRKLPKFGTPRL